MSETKKSPTGAVGEKYQPESLLPKMSYAKFWGTRGSVPVAGLEYFRYGGNTVCLEVREGKKSLIFDAGTGIRPLGDELIASDIREVHVFIGHSHWDHVMGFPFFSPIYHPDFTIHVYGETSYEKGIEGLFKGILAEDFFPVSLDDMAAKLVFHDLKDLAPITVGRKKIEFHHTNHPGLALCFKVSDSKMTLGYVTDNEFLEGYLGHPNDITIDDKRLDPYRGLITFFSDCDKLCHEAQYTSSEYEKKVGWGHSSISNAAILMKLTNSKEWIITHHDPSHGDQVLNQKLQMHQEVLQESNIDCRCYMAHDGLLLPF